MPHTLPLRIHPLEKKQKQTQATIIVQTERRGKKTHTLGIYFQRYILPKQCHTCAYMPPNPPHPRVV